MFAILNSFLTLKKAIGSFLVLVLSIGYSLGLSIDFQGVRYEKGTYVTHCFYSPTKKLGIDEFIGKRGEYNIHLAKNEYEGCVIAIRSKFCSPSKKYDIVFSDFKNENGDILDCKVYKEKYVNCYSRKDYGNYPEIMESIPLNKPHEEILKYAKNWPFYIEVHADDNTKPGKYTAEVKVTRKDNEKVQMVASVTATVWDFALPKATKCDTAFGLGKGDLAKAYALDIDSKEATEKYIEYYNYLLDRRISAYDLPYDILDKRADKYMSDPRITSFIIPYPEDDKLLVKYYEKVQSNPEWAKKGCFYPIDEPKSEEDYKRYKEITDRLKRLCPGYHMVTPFGGFEVEMNGEKISTPTLQKSSDIVCPISDNYSNEEFRKQIEERRADGSKIWWYVCCGPGGKYCNVFTHWEGIKARMLFWQQKQYNINGILYWNSNFWSKVDSPWNDQHTTPWTGFDTFGDGNLFYPGKDGPVPSLRLLLISSGIEDFEMLTMAEELFGREYIDEKIGKVSKNLESYTLDDEKLENVRIEIGNDIEKELKK